jgi:hypothetical protein
MSITCEKCAERASTVLCIEEPDWPYDPVAGWFKCDECHDEDPDGWSYVLDAEQFDHPTLAADLGDAPAPKPAGKRADDELIEWAYELHQGGMKLADVAREAMKRHPYKNEQSACASLRVNFKRRGWEVRGRQKAAAA